MKNLSLDVYLQQQRCGQLSIDQQGAMTFVYLQEYLEKLAVPALSQSLPLQQTIYNMTQARPFFSGLLPEANLRRAIAAQLGVSEKNDFALLAAIGGDCAGAVTVLPQNAVLSELIPDYRFLNEAELLAILNNMHQRPMIVGEDGIRLSLAGAQDKLPVALINGEIAIPMNGAASTHILKPINRDFPSLIENECFCLNLAKKLGLNTAEASIRYVKGAAYLLVTRYDRLETPQGIQRLHQEDFCQALAISPEMKYQREGGPTISDCFQLLRQISSLPIIDIKELLQGILFNLIIGNNDAHGKNFSLLYQGSQKRLAPFYDMISTVHYPNLSAKMAMKIGSKYEFERLFPRHIIQMAEEVELSGNLVLKETISLINRIKSIISDSPFTPGLLFRADQLLNRIEYALHN